MDQSVAISTDNVMFLSYSCSAGSKILTLPPLLKIPCRPLAHHTHLINMTEVISFPLLKVLTDVRLPHEYELARSKDKFLVKLSLSPTAGQCHLPQN